MAYRDVCGERQLFMYNCGLCRHDGREHKNVKQSKSGYDCVNKGCLKHFSFGKKKKDGSLLFYDPSLSADEMELNHLETSMHAEKPNMNTKIFPFLWTPTKCCAFSTCNSTV